MLKSIPNFLLSVDDTADNENVYDTSYVSNPATEKSFLCFEADKAEVKQAFATVDGYERMTSGVWMMPDTKYLRKNEKGLLYTVEFTKETLKEALLKYLKSNHANNVTVEHGEDLLDGFVAIEHWIIEDENTKSPVFGLSLTDLGYNPAEIPQGTVMKTTYVADETFWNEQVLTGNVTGYSIGGLFNMQKFSAEVTKVAVTESNISKLFKDMGLIQESGNVLLNDGNALSLGTDNLINDGEYQLANGMTIVMKDNQLVDYGKLNVAETKQEDITVEDFNEVAVEVASEPVAVPVEVAPEIVEEIVAEVAPVSLDTPASDEVIVPAVDMPVIETTEVVETIDLAATVEDLKAQLSLLLEANDAKDEQIANMTKALDKQPIKTNTSTSPTSLRTHNSPKPNGVALKIGNKTVQV